MQNDTWACFECRTASRRPTGQFIMDGELPKLGQADRRVRCPSCAAPCRFLGQTVIVPRKNAVKAWQKLLERVDAESVDRASQRGVQRVRWSQAVERAGQKWRRELETRPPNTHRAKLIAKLKRRSSGA